MNIKNIGAPSAIYLRGLPNCTGGVGLAATPSDGKTPSHSSLVVPFLVLHAISYVTGLQLFGHNLEKHGQILQTIAPVRGKEVSMWSPSNILYCHYGLWKLFPGPLEYRLCSMSPATKAQDAFMPTARMLLTQSLSAQSLLAC